MTKYSSKELQIVFNGVEITGNGASLDVDESQAAVDVTCFQEDDGEYIADGVTHRKASYAGFDGTAETIFDALIPGTTGNLVFYPQGSSAGLPVVTISAIATNRKRGFKVQKAVAISAEFQLTGARTDDTVS